MRFSTSIAALALWAGAAGAQSPRFSVTVPASVHAGALTGRLVIAIAKTAQPEPRLALSLRGPLVVAVDLEQVAAGVATGVDAKAVGYPGGLATLPPGDYFAQAVVNVYEQVHRSDGKNIWLHMNDGTIEFFSAAEGNLYSDVVPMHVGYGGVIRLDVSHVIPAAPKLVDTDWVKHVTFQSPMLTKFWGRPIFLHASVLLPKGYAEHPNVRYPSVYALGHGTTPFSFSTRPPTPPAGAAAGPGPAGGINPNTGLEGGYATYTAWNGDAFPRVIAITLQQQTPYFPDSYSVNSANNGPYGDAVTQEMIPFLEEKFRILREPWARHLEGASTSGWQTLALMLQHPDMFGGAWVLQPDPIDFTRYGMVNAYADSNAFSVPLGPFLSTERYFQRTGDGQGLYSTRQLSLFEDVLGSHGRAAFQLEAWEAVYGPVGEDGYPKPLWNKQTGIIDHSVATYMRDHGFDLRAYAEANWPALGPKVQGKLHFFAGDMDDYWLNLAVYKFEEFAKRTTNPVSDAEFTYGRPMKGHSWHAWTWAQYVRLVGEALKAHMPTGEESRRWIY